MIGKTEVLTGFMLALGVLAAALGPSSAQAKNPAKPVVRIVELDIDPAQLETYKSLLTEEVEASVRLEPGVLALNAVSMDESPAHIRLLEIYASEEAYQAHLTSPQFLKYKHGTAGMVKSLRLTTTHSVKLCAKTGFSRGGAASCL